MARVSVVNVVKKYGETLAVDHVHLECRDSEFLVILGPAGAGKTSLLKMIAGIEDITEGDIYLDDTRINGRDPAENDTAMTFETYALYPHLTVHDNLAFPLRSKLRKTPWAEMEATIRNVASLLGLEDLLGRFPSELSGGQRQRVSFGRALVRSPRVFLLDEPISHLDAKLRHEMRRELKKLKTRIRTSVIYVTHDYLEAMSLADRIVVLDKGRVLQTGPAGEVHGYPASLHVARLMGFPPSNLIEGHIQEEGGGVVFRSGPLNFKIRLDPSWKGAFARLPCRTLTVGIRPSQIRIATEEGTLWGRRKTSQRRGWKSIDRIDVEGVPLTVFSQGSATSQAGSSLPVFIEPDSILLFDGAGTRIPKLEKGDG
jgi:multiple sugar transport system ATP-binding protein